MQQSNAEAWQRVQRARETLHALLGGPCAPAPPPCCPVCGAPLSEGDRLYAARDGTALGCDTCVEYHFQ